VSLVAGNLIREHINNFNEWSPHMNVVESGSDYVVTIELLGVSASTIWVKVNDERLVVTGQSSTEWWRDGNKKYVVYHKWELSEGPYYVVWHLPSNINKDVVSAEFVWVNVVVFNSCRTSPCLDGIEESTMYRFGSIGKNTQKNSLVLYGYWLTRCNDAL